MRERVLVTGGAGYLGCMVVPLLLQAGYKVVVLDNFLYRQTTLLDLCSNDQFEIVRGDARDENLLRGLLKKADIVLPLAAIVGYHACDKDPVAARTVNVDAIRLLLSHRSRDQRVVFPCTNSGYGVGERGAYCTETSPLKPISVYGKTKVEAEKAIMDSGNAVSLRLATNFGMSPRMRLDLLVNDFVYRAVTDRFVVVFEGNFKRNYVHVRDAAEAFRHVLGNFETMKDQVYNVGLSDANLSKLELCAEIRKQLPQFIYLEAGVGKDPDQRDYVVSNEKIEATGFRPKHSVQYGITELIKGFRIVRRTEFTN